jgi:hypothetical protein
LLADGPAAVVLSPAGCMGCMGGGEGGDACMALLLLLPSHGAAAATSGMRMGPPPAQATRRGTFAPSW